MPAGSDPSTVARLILAAELRSGSVDHFENAIAELGSSLRIGLNVWLLRAAGTAGTARNSLVPRLGSRDALLVIEIGSGRIAAHNVGLEVEAKSKALLRAV